MKSAIIFGFALLLIVSQVLGHCQMPCGIYDDGRRLDTIAEDITTVEKAIKQVEALSEETPPDYNQIVRWINVKEQHADDIAEIASWYFLQQRVKPVEKSDGGAYEHYIQELKALHQMMIYSMKAKQSLDMANVENLRSTLHEFRDAYLREDEHPH